MPSVSRRQQKAMAAAASGRSAVGIPRKVGKSYMAHDKGMARKRGRKNGLMPTRMGELR